MHSLNCCDQSDVLAAYWITGTVVGFQEESGGGKGWKNTSDIACLNMSHLKVQHAAAFYLMQAIVCLYAYEK